MTIGYRMVSSLVGRFLMAGIIISMLIPVATIVVMSFSNDEILLFPPKQWGIDQYASFVTSDYWLTALRKSLEVALPSAALAVIIGVPVVLALRGSSAFPFRGFLLAIGVSPLVIPAVAYALAVYVFYLDVHLAGTAIGVVLIYAALALPFVLLIVGGVYDRIPKELELVAMSLGASSARAVVGITLRLLLPGIGAAFIFGFITAFDDAVFINFIGSPSLITLPKAIYDSLSTSMAPLINAIATILMLATGLSLSLASYWRYSFGRKPLRLGEEGAAGD
ncbi:MAG TPA: ABC transporter permease [Alphaproteobacteria bacterium]|nr:ABC transporter permease [Alphaproteobacteria bacterium]